MRRLCALGLVACSCSASFDATSYVQGLRVLAIKAEPPEVAPGQAAALTSLAVDTVGTSINIDWVACTLQTAPGTTLINPECFNFETASFLLPLGSGLSLNIQVPPVNPADFGPPDASGGLYLPLRGRARAAGQEVDGVYQLRLATGVPPNHNPTLTAVSVVTTGGALSAIQDGTPLPVHSKDQITLRATFSSDSAETYSIVTPGQQRTVQEILRVSWFATAGTFSENITGGDKPDTVWTADKHLPAAGSVIDLWVVGRDERGGTDFLHRSFILQ